VQSEIKTLHNNIP